MIIDGGTVFILKDDESLPALTIRHAQVVMDVRSNFELDEAKDFLIARLGDGSKVVDCKFTSTQDWSRRKASDTIIAASGGMTDIDRIMYRWKEDQAKQSMWKRVVSFFNYGKQSATARKDGL